MSFKLAFRNVRRSIKDYAVYFLTLTFGVCLFYVFSSGRPECDPISGPQQ